MADLRAAPAIADVLVIDNASTDGSTDTLDVAVRRRPVNTGFAGGAQDALEWAAAQHADALLLLNQDARLDTDGVARLIALLADDPNLGAVFGKVVRRDRPFLLDGLWGRRNLRHKLTTDLGGGRVDTGRPALPRFVDHGHGAAMLLRVTAALAVGGFDRALLAYHEEVDLCWRLALAHYSVALEPRAVVRHLGPTGDARRETAKHYLLARNSVLVATKNGGTAARWRVGAWALAATLVYYGPVALTGNPLARALVRGWCDGWRGRPVHEAFRALL